MAAWMSFLLLSGFLAAPCSRSDAAEARKSRSLEWLLLLLPVVTLLLVLPTLSLDVFLLLSVESGLAVEAAVEAAGSPPSSMGMGTVLGAADEGDRLLALMLPLMLKAGMGSGRMRLGRMLVSGAAEEDASRGGFTTGAAVPATLDPVASGESRLTRLGIWGDCCGAVVVAAGAEADDEDEEVVGLTEGNWYLNAGAERLGPNSPLPRTALLSSKADPLGGSLSNWEVGCGTEAAPCPCCCCCCWRLKFS